MTPVTTSLLIACLLILIIVLIMFISIQFALNRHAQTMMLVIEAIGKLTQAQKSCLSYLQKIEKEIDSYDGK